MPHITQREVALASGYSQSLVSRALQGHPQVPAETRRKVLAIAERLGYRPDPVVSALANRRWVHGQDDAGWIAWLAGPVSRSRYHQCSYVAHVQAHAHRLGYRFAQYHLPTDGDPTTVLRALRQRRFQGIILSQDFPEVDAAGGWSGHVVVRCGLLGSPPSPLQVRFHTELLLPLVVESVRRLGYRSIAIAAPVIPGTLLERQFRSGWTLLAREQRHDIRLQSFSYENQRPLMPWAAGRREDALVVGNELHVRLLRERFPEEMARRRPVAVIAGSGQDPAIAGIVLDYRACAEAAVELVDARLRRGLTGWPETARTQLIAPVWRDAASMPPAAGRGCGATV